MASQSSLSSSVPPPSTSIVASASCAATRLALGFVGVVGTGTVALAAPAASACTPASAGPSVARLPDVWRAAVNRLMRTTAEEGHPWSCSGGVVDVELGSSGAMLRVARAGEPAITRPVATPDDVMPLGQALLAAPLEPAPEAPDPAPATTGDAHAGVDEPSAPAAAPPAPPPEKEPRVLLAGGLDGRAAFRSGVAMMGPQLSATLPLGRWLAGIGFRYQTAVSGGGPPLDEIATGLSVQRRFAARSLELRAGPVVRGGVVLRDLPRPQGAQGEVQARVGAAVAAVVPVLRWANVVVGIDADVVVLSRRTADATISTTTPTSEIPKPFPSGSLGGSVVFEVSL